MSSQFERFRPLRTPDSIADLFRPDEGISPEDAGKEDAKEAMNMAIAALNAAKEKAQRDA